MKRKKHNKKIRKKETGKKTNYGKKAAITALCLFAAVTLVWFITAGQARMEDNAILLENPGEIHMPVEKEQHRETQTAKPVETKPLPEEKTPENTENLEEPIEESEAEVVEGENQEKITLSILGDSISTFDEWIPEGYLDFFPMSGEVTDVGQTWWKMLLDSTEMTLCVNGSSSGSTCVGDSTSGDNPQYGCSDYRIAGLTGEGGLLPDVIVVYMGTNDLITSVPLGDNDGTRTVAEGVVENFSDAYTLMLDKLASYYPETKIFCCTLAPVGDWGTEQPFVTFVNGQGNTYVEYCDTIRKIAGTKGYPVIDLQNCGITMENMQQYITDGVHLKPEGMVLVHERVQNTLKEYGYE